MQALRTVRIGGFKRLKWKKKEEEGLAFCSGVQADEIKRLGGLGERNGLSGHLDVLSRSRWEKPRPLAQCDQ